MYSGFPRKLLDKVRCPLDGGDIRIIEEREFSDERIFEAHLTCSDCAASFRIEDGILDLLSNGAEVPEEMKQEVEARDDDADEYDDFTDQPWYRLEIPITIEHLSDLENREIAEFGSGTGRITLKIIKKAAATIAIDFSRLSLHRLARRLSEADNIGLILGDITGLRFRPACFDIAVSTQVLEHIPSPQLRGDFMNVVRNCLRPDGYFLCTAYYHDMRRRLRREPREGFHESGIFYHYFNKPELFELFSACMKVTQIHTFLSHVPMVWRLQFIFPRLIGFFEKTPFLREFGSLILVKAAKKPD